MKNTLTVLSCTIISSLLIGCGESDSPFAAGGISSGTNIVSEKNFNLAYDNGNPPVLSGTGIDTSVQVVATFSAADKSGLAASGATAYLEVDWGTLSAKSCTINASGNCSITWTANANNNTQFIPGDERITFTGWVLGEESYSDLNGNGTFDDGDIFINDSSGPFLDLDHSGDFSAGDQILTPGNLNGQLTAADGLFNGTDCNHSSLCSTTTQIYISDRDILSIREAP